MAKISLFGYTAVFCALMSAVCFSSCADENDALDSLHSELSASYYITGQVCNKAGEALGGIEVTMTPQQGAVLSGEEEKWKGVVTTDKTGKFTVGLLLARINGDLFDLEFKDNNGVYETRMVVISIENVKDKFYGGEGNYQGEYTETITGNIVMYKPGEQKPEEPDEEQDKGPTEE